MWIGLTGKAGSGKDTVASWLVENRGYRQLSFAGTLKKGLAAMGMPEPKNRDDKEKPVLGMDFTWRQAAQTLGTEWGRNLDKGIWLKLTIQQAMAFGEGADIVFSDVRFENEAQAIRDAGGMILHIKGREARLGADALHDSEMVLSIHKEDGILNNCGSLEEFYSLLERIYYVPR